MKNIMKFRSLVLLCLLTLGLHSWAAEGDSKNNPCVMENSGEYSLQMADWYGTFTVPKDVTTDDIVLEMVCTSMRLFAYTDAEMKNEVEMTVEGNFSPYSYSMPIPNGTKKGTVYYFHKEFDIQSNNGILRVTYGAPTDLKVVSTTPEDNSVLSASTAFVTVEFNKNIAISGCKVYIADEEYSSIANVMGRFVSIDIRNLLFEAYANGMKKGDAIKVVFKNVTTSDKSLSLGDVTLNFTVADRPTSLVSTSNTPGNGLDKFLSWMPANYEHGIVTLTFDADLDMNNIPNARLEYGNIEFEGESYGERLPVTFVDSRTIAVDLRGVLRTPTSMNIVSKTVYETMSLMFSNIIDSNGNYTFSETSGIYGSYGFNYLYKIVEYELTTEFTPAKGGNIDKAKNVEMWVRESGDGVLTFEGAKFSYVYEGQEASVDVALENIKVEADPEDEYARIITVDIPEFSRDANTDIKFELTGVTFPDGNEYADKVSAVFKTSGYATSIDGVSVDADKEDAMYNINGMKMKSAKTKNIYISKGKKIIR